MTAITKLGVIEMTKFCGEKVTQHNAKISPTSGHKKIHNKQKLQGADMSWTH